MEGSFAQFPHLWGEIFRKQKFLIRTVASAKLLSELPNLSSKQELSAEVQEKKTGGCAIQKGLKMGIAALALLITINIGYGQSTPVIEPAGNEIVIKAGQSIILTCSGNDTVKWDIQNLPKRSTVIQGGVKAVLTITKAKHTDTKTYKCLYSKANSSDNASVHLYVKGSQYWHTQEERVPADEGTDAVLPCLITDPSIPTSQISLQPSKTRDNQPISAKFNAQKGFIIHNVQMAYDTIYTCQANVYGVIHKSDEITLSVRQVEKSPPSVVLDHEHYIRTEGEEFKITCRATSSTSSLKTDWEYPAKNVSLTSDLKYDGKWTEVSILNVPAVKIKDTGNYTCIGKNRVGSSRSVTFLQVVEKGFVDLSTSQNSSVTLSLGDCIDLAVQIDAYPTNLSWKWIHVHNNMTKDVSSLGKMHSNGRYRNFNNLTLNRMKERESGTYSLYVENSEATNNISFEIIFLRPPVVEISTFKFNGTIILNCSAWGNPLPSIKWLQCLDDSCEENGQKVISDSKTRVIETRVESILAVDQIQFNYSTVCIASNSEGIDRKLTPLATAALEVKKIVQHELFSPLLVVLTAMGIFFFLLTIFLYYKYKQKPRYEVRWQIVKVSEGNNYTCIDPTQLPYNEKWEFPRNNLHFGKTLGAGAFGKVIEAKAFGMGKDDTALRVAVKMLKPSAHTDEMEALLSELKILSHLGHHQNIVNLLGACTHGGPILVITEYCQHGDLLNFLRNKAEAMNKMFTASLAYGNSDYKNVSVEQKYTASDTGFSSQGTSNYLEMKPVSSNTNSEQGNSNTEVEEDTDDHLPLDLYDLLNFSLQIAQGMNFLAAKSCIHRDVAARNVLVAQGRVAKICDFGLARDIENDANYVVKGNARLPVKWMAPESIFDCIYTVQSDVWSYGILLWEIFSLGRSPYPGILINRKFYKMIKDGYKMDCPEYAPLEIYHIMKACWDLEPTQRPTFNQISDLINKQMSHIQEQDYANISQVHQEEECLDTKCDPEESFIKGNNYQFC
ncbi:macrophage colony-stimulating factor 1 receptor [Spea bombifrons]|uniref:macrophage colony-stimulating factor 1 receptor n=1 Tax=Spea bombifrons TaxID=233779 RepID=UPI00234A6FAE|nr:macrophage colony-stimulating factor 1 receptor [Spea bombifrons]